MKFSIKDVFDWLKTAGVKPTTEGLNLSLDLIKEEYDELLDAIKSNDKKEQLDACIDLFWVISNYLYHSNISNKEIKNHIKKVSEQNWSKFDTNIDDAEKSVAMYKKGVHPNKMNDTIDAYYKKVKNYYVILRKKDNKILKSYKYTEE